MGDNTRQTDKSGQAEQKVKKRNAELQAGLRQPPHGEDRPEDKTQHGRAVREHLAAIVNRRIALEGLAQHVADMLARGPQAGKDQEEHRALRQVGDAGRSGHRVGLRRANAPAKQPLDPSVDIGEKGEEPHAERDIEAQQVRKPDDLEARIKVHAHGFAQKAQRGIQLDEGEVVEVGVQAIDEIDEKREQKADPSQIVAQQRRQQTALLPLGQFERQDREREEQSLVFHPLLAQDDQHAERDEVNAEYEEPPSQHRLVPQPPGHGLAARRPLKELPDRRAVLGHEPGFDVRVNDIGPVVLRRGEVKQPP